MTSQATLSPTKTRHSRKAVPTDALLQASRRIDWRFLLPDPNLGNVLYISAAGDGMAESLEQFATSLTVIDDGSQLAGRSSRYDLVVACEPSHATLRTASERLVRGGWLYVEAHRKLGRNRRTDATGDGADPNRRPLRHASDYLSAARQLGLVDVAAHWHWPNFETCAEIVPMNRRAAMAHVFARRTGSHMAKLKAVAGRGLVRVGLFARLVPCFSIVARRGANQ